MGAPCSHDQKPHGKPRPREKSRSEGAREEGSINRSGQALIDQDPRGERSGPYARPAFDWTAVHNLCSPMENKGGRRQEVELIKSQADQMKLPGFAGATADAADATTSPKNTCRDCISDMCACKDLCTDWLGGARQRRSDRAKRRGNPHFQFDSPRGELSSDSEAGSSRDPIRGMGCSPYPASSLRASPSSSHPPPTRAQGEARFSTFSARAHSGSQWRRRRRRLLPRLSPLEI